MASDQPMPATVFLPVRDYDLSVTLQSGQAFRWRETKHGWEGVIQQRWVRLVPQPNGLLATVAGQVEDWVWLRRYLQTETDLAAILASFPQDEPMRQSVRHGQGLRLLKQDPWECLASFILSSMKRIVQIQEMVELICRRFGDPIASPVSDRNWWTFPSAERLAACGEGELRACKMGFRAPGLLKTSRLVASGAVNLAALDHYPIEEARQVLMGLPGVGRKIADCVLLFAYGFDSAFPVDVWVAKALRELYFPKRRPSAKRLDRFVRTYFGPHAGYAQQYLFHYMRTRRKIGGIP